MRWFSLIVTVLLSLIIGPVQAEAFTLNDGNARLVIDPTGAFTTQEWTVDGEPNLVHGSGYWFDASRPVGTYTPRTVAAQTAPNVLDVGYDLFSGYVSVRYTLQGGSAGSGEARVIESLTLFSFSSAWIQPVYLYNDYNLSPADTAAPNAGGSLIQSGGDRSLVIASTAPPIHHEVNDPQALLAKFDGAGPLLLSDSPPVGRPFSPPSGDVASALQWQFTVAPNASQTITTMKRLMRGSPSDIPEPSSVALLSVAAIPMMKRRRRA